MYHSALTRRRAFTTTITIVVVTAATVFAGAGSVAMSLEPTTAAPGVTASQDGTPNGKALTGSWLETVTFPPEFGRPPLRSLSSYHGDGTMSCTDQGNVTTDPAMVFSACHGAWTHVHSRTFAYTALELISDLSGNLVGLLKFRGTYTVSTSGAEYEGTTVAEILDTDGNVLTSLTVTNKGQRIQVELP